MRLGAEAWLGESTPAWREGANKHAKGLAFKILKEAVELEVGTGGLHSPSRGAVSVQSCSRILKIWPARARESPHGLAKQHRCRVTGTRWSRSSANSSGSTRGVASVVDGKGLFCRRAGCDGSESDRYTPIQATPGRWKENAWNRARMPITSPPRKPADPDGQFGKHQKALQRCRLLLHHDPVPSPGPRIRHAHHVGNFERAGSTA